MRTREQEVFNNWQTSIFPQETSLLISNLTLLKNGKLWGWRWTAQTALLEDQSSVPCTHISWLTAAFNSSSRNSDALFWPWHYRRTHVFKQTRKMIRQQQSVFLEDALTVTEAWTLIAKQKGPGETTAADSLTQPCSTTKDECNESAPGPQSLLMRR